MPVTPPPHAEVDVDEALVRAMLREQHADLAELPLELVASGGTTPCGGSATIWWFGCPAVPSRCR